jgi:hypothetical protein
VTYVVVVKSSVNATVAVELSVIVFMVFTVSNVIFSPELASRDAAKIHGIIQITLIALWDLPAGVSLKAETINITTPEYARRPYTRNSITEISANILSKLPK